MRRFLTPVDMTQLEVRNLRLHMIAGDPPTPVDGQVWFDTTAAGGDGRAKVRIDGTTYVLMVDGSDIPVGSIPLDRLAVDFDTQVRTSRLDQMAAPTAPVDMNGQRIIGVAAPEADTDAVNRLFVTQLIDGRSWKAAVRATTTGNIALSGEQTIDGVALVTGDRVLVKDQTDAEDNGIYDVAAGAWARSSDFTTGDQARGAVMVVMEGTTNGDTKWLLVTDPPITIGTTELDFEMYGSGGGDYTAGDGLQLVGNQFSVVADTGILVSGTGVAIDPAVVTRKYATDVGDGVETSIVVNHALGTRDVIVDVFDAATYDTVICDVVRTDANNVTLTFAVAPTAAEFRAVITG